LTEVTFRRAGTGDVPDIHELLVENAVNDHAALRGTQATLMRYGFGDDPRFRVVLACEGEAVGGLTLVFPEYSSWRGTVGIFVQDLYLRPHLRGRGLGRGLLGETLRLCADWEPAFVTLIVHHGNLAAREFYAAQGFVLRERADLLVLEGPRLAALVG
jgi:GNAT superfamily N-acetyltransferase